MVIFFLSNSWYSHPRSGILRTGLWSKCNSLRRARRISGRRFSPYFSEGEKRRPEMRLVLRRLLEHEQGYKGNSTLFEIFGLQYYFPENFRCYLKFSKARIFLIPLSIAFSTPKIRFPFLHRRRPKGDQSGRVKRKRSSRLFSRPDRPPLGLRGYFFYEKWLIKPGEWNREK